jgi:5-methyltetrahydrofolate--homocysteine methyltransferase
VKIAPNLGQSTVHVHDASKAVGVVASLLDAERKSKFDENNRGVQQRLRDLHRAKQEKPLIPYVQAVENAPKLDWIGSALPKPCFSGRRIADVSLAEIVPYIDWTFFFSAWELKGRFPAILDDPKQGEAAREIYAHGQELLERIVAEDLLRAKGVYGFWPANSDGDDIVLYSDEGREHEKLRFSMLRQQEARTKAAPHRSLADFIAPVDSGAQDWLGAFAVTAGIGADALSKSFKDGLDDYNAIMTQAIADRLAEAFAELLHARARKDWGIGEDDQPDFNGLIGEQYQGIRPAFGYPACPDHTLKGSLFDLLGANDVGIELTESYAMTPGASVSGIYFSHPEAKYFNVGRVNRDQISSYARRKGVPTREAEKWLAPNLAYDPEDAG